MAGETCNLSTHIEYMFPFIYSHESVIHQETGAVLEVTFFSSCSFTVEFSITMGGESYKTVWFSKINKSV